MAKARLKPSGVERTFGEDELIVSKTNLKGHLTYTNDVFLRIARFEEEEVMGQPHALVRHPDMPRCVFKLLWDTIQAKKEIFAYVLNLAKDGAHYWVFAHVTPSLDNRGNLVGFHSNRRVPDKAQVEKVSAVYKQLLDVENSAPDRKQGMQAGFNALVDLLNEKGVSYDEFVFSI